MLILLAFLAGVALALLAVSWWLTSVFAALEAEKALDNHLCICPNCNLDGCEQATHLGRDAGDKIDAALAQLDAALGRA